MLTRQGWFVGLGAIGLAVSGRVFGLVELYIAAAAVGVLLAGCAALTAFSRLDLAAGRDVRPLRVHAGTPARAEVRLRNARSTRTPVLRLRDPVSGTSGADLLVSPLRSGQTASLAYRLPTDERGLIEIGPLDVVVSDPFGLTSIRTRAAGTATLTVFPRVDKVRPPRMASGPDPTSGTDHPSALGRSGDEFFALRPYVVGDDLRRVHWPSTARTGELIVRQDELPWQGRSTVVLDQRRGTYTRDEFERAVSAAASILDAAWRRSDLVRLAATDGTDTGFGSGHAHLELIMETLAVVNQTNRSDLSSAVGRLERSGTNGALICVTGEVRPSELVDLSKQAIGFGALTAVSFSPTRTTGVTSSLSVLSVRPDDDFAAVWQQAMPRRRAGARA